MNTHYLIFNFDKKTCEVRTELSSAYSKQESTIKTYENVTDCAIDAEHRNNVIIISDGAVVWRSPLLTTVIIYEYDK